MKNICEKKLKMLRSLSEQIKTQDDELDELDKGLIRLYNASKSHNEELKTQNKMLNELDRDIELGNEDINTINAKLRKIIGNNKDYPCYIIVILSFVLFILICLVIFL